MIAKIMKAVISKENVKNISDEPEAIVKPEHPKQSELAAKYNRLVAVDEELKKQNQAIFKKEQKLSDLEDELAEMKGWFKGKQRSELEQKIADIQTQISNMKKYLSAIVRPYGYQNVKQFYAEFRASKTEYDAYQKAVSKWNGGANNIHERISITAKLKSFRENSMESENSSDLTSDKPKNRDVR